jgi:uncharacterized cupredoxin-like copper-binding protein
MAGRDDSLGSMNKVILIVTLMSALLIVACTGGGSDVRTLRIEATDSGCEPSSFDVNPGQRVRLVLENESEAVYELSDPEGRIESLEAPPGEDTEQFADLPDGTATYILRCTSDSGSDSEIRIHAGEAEGPEPTSAPSAAADGTSSPDDPDTTLAVSLADYTVTLSETTVQTGRVMFIATNVSSGQAHELNILQLQPDGSFQNEGGIAPMAPQQGGSVLANLRAGTYRIACMIQIGEQGSTVDHYQQGMWADLVVEE